MRILVCDLCQTEHRWMGGKSSVSIDVDNGRTWVFDICDVCRMTLDRVKREEILELFRRVTVHPEHQMAEEGS